MWERLIEKAPAWLIAFSLAGFFILIAISIYLEKPFTIVGLNFGAIESQRNLDELGEISSLPVGTVIASAVSPANFEHYFGKGWVPADGREVNSKTQYYKITGNRNVPDLRGRFIRGIDPTGQIDPGGNRQVGNLQDDATKKPNVSWQIEASGNHIHSASVGNVYTTKHAHLDGGGGFRALWAAHQRSPEKTNVSIEEKGSHQHSVSGGDKETRPKNTALHFYIRIGSTQPES